MANDRLQAFGTANKAVFAINDATLTRQGDVVVGSEAGGVLHAGTARRDAPAQQHSQRRQPAGRNCTGYDQSDR